MSFIHAYNSVFNKLFKSFDSNVIMCCQFYSNCLCFEMLYEMNRYIFLSKLVHFNCLDSKSEIDKPDYRDYVAFQIKYGFKDTDSACQIRHRVWNYFKSYIHDIEMMKLVNY